MDAMAILKNNVPQILKDRKMSITDLMRVSGLSYPSVYKMGTLQIVPDTMNMGTLRKVAEGLGLKISDLIEEQED